MKNYLSNFLFLTFSLMGTDFSHRVYPYSTHQPVLHKVASITTGPIIEFGCGHGSTKLLHEICKKTGRTLITLEDHQGWLTEFSKQFIGDGYEVNNSGWHKFYFVPGKKNDTNYDHWVNFFETSEIFNTYTFDLCFIDQSPWMARYETVMRLKDKVKYIILHDCDYFPHVGIFGKVIKACERNVPGVYDFSDIFAAFKVYFPLTPWPGASGPPTLLGSDIVANLPEVDYSKY